MQPRADDFGSGCFGLVLIGAVVGPALFYLLSWAV